MNLFLRKVALFLILLLCLTFAALGVLNYLNKKALENFRVKPGVTSIFVGDSHIQCAINDALLPKSSNFSQSAEASYFTYYKLEALLRNNPSVKKVYLGFGCHNISTHYDEYITGEHSKDIAARYFFILPLSEKLYIIRNNSVDPIQFLANLFAEGMKNRKLKDNSNSVLGHYENYFSRVAANQSSIRKRVKMQFYENGQLRDFSKVNMLYNQKIIDLCKTRKLELIILNTPLHPYYEARIPAPFVQKYDSIVKRNHLKLYDFSALKLTDSAYVPDGDHISSEGSYLTTALFKE